MNISICLDQYASNYNLNALSSNGFSVYTDLDNFTTPIAQGIPYQNLFSPPVGNCPYLLTNVPAGATQLLVIDNCTFDPTLGAENAIQSTAQELLIDCCYALLDIPQDPPPPFCVSCSLDFDIFSSSFIGQIVAGNLTSTCGPVTDYTIGWYLNGDYSSPLITSGYGNSFLPYQNIHPLTGSAAVPALAGNWEGIIHDIAINGIIYSSVSGSANGQPIPFTSCFDTIVVQPLECDNGPYAATSKYAHQFNFNSQAVGTTPSPTSFTYVLNPTTKYFAYAFRAFSVNDELEIKWKSGNPSATSNPSLYSQPIYLEKIKVGSDIDWQSYYPNTNDPIQIALTASQNPFLPGFSPNYFPFNGQYNGVNNIWPKLTPAYGFFQRTLTLTTLETSSNPLYPDLLEITVTPSTNNNNTQWKAGFTCLDDFDCTDCHFDNWTNSLPKIFQFYLQKWPGCDQQKLWLYLTASCSPTSDWMGASLSSLTSLNTPQALDFNLIGSYSPNFNPSQGFGLPSPPISLVPNKGCYLAESTTVNCGPASSGQIIFNETPGQIQLTFNSYSNYQYYKDSLIAEFGDLNVSSPYTQCSGSGNFNLDWYKGFSLHIPIQGINANCGDNTTHHETRFHINDYFNTQYVESPSTNTWSITIPKSTLGNCYAIEYEHDCNFCYNSVEYVVSIYNIYANQTFSFTTNIGAKYINPFRKWKMVNTTTGTVYSGSYCFSHITLSQTYPWYGTHTIPFISSSNGWINLPTLGAFVPCSSKTGSYLYSGSSNIDRGVYYEGYIAGYKMRFPNLTGSFNDTLSTNDFEIYATVGFGDTGSYHSNSSLSVCPDPSSSLIYSYIGGVATVHTSSYFWNGVAPSITIDPS